MSRDSGALFFAPGAFPGHRGATGWVKRPPGPVQGNCRILLGWYRYLTYPNSCRRPDGGGENTKEQAMKSPRFSFGQPHRIEWLAHLRAEARLRRGRTCRKRATLAVGQPALRSSGTAASPPSRGRVRPARTWHRAPQSVRFWVERAAAPTGRIASRWTRPLPQNLQPAG